MANQKGLKWVQEMFGPEPRWTAEPAIEIIGKLARKHLSLDQNECFNVEFHAQGAFNKLYRVRTENDTFMMRVALPVDPYYKTQSEVATIRFVSQKTGIPVPKILAFDSSNENELGFEWILMELMPGKPLRTHWRKIPMDTKQDLVRRIALYQAQLFRNKFTGIGNIFGPPEEQQGACQKISKKTDPSVAIDEQAASAEDGEASFAIDRLVSIPFFLGDHLTQEVSKGPFTNSHDWLRARLTFILNDQERILKESDDEDEVEDAETAQDLANRLLGHLPQIMPSSHDEDDEESPPETSVLFHQDHSMQNILVTEDGQISAVIDWECVSALPLWRICQFPAFLQGRQRDEEPHRDQYIADAPEEYNAPGYSTTDELDNEGVNPLYWRHLLEYEQTVLRRTFMAEMEVLAPGWVAESKKGVSALKADFDIAVQHCDNDLTFKAIGAWLDTIRDGGEIWSLRDRFRR